MARDYAKKRSPTRQAAKATKSGIPGWMWLATGLFVGLFVAGLVFLKNNAQQTPIVNKTTTAKEHHNNQATNTTNHPKFDFYTMLPQSEMTLSPKSDAEQQQHRQQIQQPQQGQQPQQTQQVAQPEQPNVVVKPKQQFVLQVASFRSFSDADRLKAQLALLGYQVNVSAFKQGNDQWNRVWVGPFNTREQALKEQAKLKSNQVDSFIVAKK